MILNNRSIRIKLNINKTGLCRIVIIAYYLVFYSLLLFNYFEFQLCNTSSERVVIWGYFILCHFGFALMLLTTKGRYAVAAMLDIVIYEHTSPVRLCDISSRQQIDLGYLEQIFMKLKRGGLVVSVKGPGGGYILNKPSTLICLEEILGAVGESVQMTRCDGGGACRSDGARCASHNLWVAFEKNIRAYLRSITLADACSGLAL